MYMYDALYFFFDKVYMYDVCYACILVSNNLPCIFSLISFVFMNITLFVLISYLCTVYFLFAFLI